MLRRNREILQTIICAPALISILRIKHYAGSVTYSVDGFVAKNSDLLERDLSAVMFQSEHPLLKTLFPEGNMKRSMRRRPATVATQFKISIGALINNLASKTAHFVRCIKPNENRLSRYSFHILKQEY